MKALLSIKPEFVSKIFTGEKIFEYRKAVFKRPMVKTVVIYSTMPVGKIVGEFEIEEIIVANSYGEIDVVIPSKIELSSPYPNPFNPVTTLELYIYNDAYVSVKVYNIMGQVVDVLINENLNKGSHVLNWNASYLPSGIYFVEAKSDYNIVTQKVTLLK